VSWVKTASSISSWPTVSSHGRIRNILTKCTWELDQTRVLRFAREDVADIESSVGVIVSITA